jgi:GYF domain 2
MQKIYINKDNLEQGPFSTDELKELKITKDTMVWFEGIDDWVKAIEVDELKENFIVTPPPLKLKSSVVSPPTIVKSKSNDILKSSQSKKQKVLLTIGLLILSFGVFGGFFLYSKKQEEIKQELEGQNKLIQEQNLKILEQERIENERNNEKIRKQKAAEAERKSEELTELKARQDGAMTSLRAAKIELNQIQDFELFRSSSDKNRQIQKALYDIRMWENEVDRLQNMINQY